METDGKVKVLENQNMEGYNCAVHYTRFLLRLFGIWPDPFQPEGFLDNFRIFIAATTMFVFITTAQTAKIVINFTNLNVVIEALGNCNIPVTIAIIKLINIWYNRRAFKALLRHIILDWQTIHTEEELSIMWKHARVSRFFSIGCIILNELPFTTQFTGSFVIPMIENVKSKFNDTLERPLYVISSFPYSTRVTPNYELTVFLQVLSTCFASLTFSATDSFFVVLVYHLIGRLAVFQVALNELPKRYKVTNDKQELINKITDIFTTHNRLIGFATNLDDSFSVMFLLQIVPCMFVLCSQGYMLITMTDADNIPVIDLIFMIYFLILFLLTIFLYCYVAEKLRQKSMEVSNAAYNCDWTVLPAEEAKLLVIIISRAQRPFKISAGKFATFSLELYTTIIKTSGGYLSMLLAIKDRQTDA